MCQRASWARCRSPLNSPIPDYATVQLDAPPLEPTDYQVQPVDRAPQPKRNHSQKYVRAVRDLLTLLDNDIGFPAFGDTPALRDPLLDDAIDCGLSVGNTRLMPAYAKLLKSAVRASL